MKQYEVIEAINAIKAETKDSDRSFAYNVAEHQSIASLLLLLYYLPENEE